MARSCWSGSRRNGPWATAGRCWPSAGCSTAAGPSRLPTARPGWRRRPSWATGPGGFFCAGSPPSAPPARLVPAFAAPRPGEFFEPLPRSGPTARQVLALAAPRPALPLLSGAAASTDRLIVELPRAGWALLYTHGYFDEKGLEEQKRRIADQLKAWRLQPGRTAEPMGLGSLSPLAYNGLALTGATCPPASCPTAVSSRPR